MLLLKLTSLDLRGLFEQGFRLVVFLILLVNYILLFFMHFFMVRPLYSLCGHKYFSVFSRWLFMKRMPSNVSASYWEIRTTCYFSNILDVTVIGFALMFLVTAIVESCLSRNTRKKLQQLDKEQGGGASGSSAVLQQRIIRKDTFRRLIFRMTISLITAIFATVNFIFIFVVFLLYHLTQTTLSAEVLQTYKSSLFALKWQIIMYLFLSFFFCGLLWSVQGIHRTQLEVIFARSKRLDQFKKMNSMVRASAIV